MKGRATHGGTLFTTASTSFFGGITLAPASIDFLAAGESLRTLSTGIGALVPNSYPQFNLLYGARFETVLTGYDPVVNVFNLTADQLERTHTLRISAPGGATVILNVSGSSAVFASQGLFLSGITANRVLFNFPDALSLYIGNIEIHGSVLAPRADVTFPAGQLNGHLVVKSLYGQGQMNHQIFWGCIPQVCTNPEGCDDGGEGPPLLISACTLTVDSWTHHLSAISGTLPLGLGAESGPYRVQVSSIELAYEILLEQAFSGGGNGITRLYAELLAARLNQAHGVSVSVVAGILGAADGFLAWHTAADWNGLSSTDKADVEAWVQALLNFNTGVTGPGRCHI